MKKWKVVVLTSILTVVIIGLSAVLVYNYYIVPKYVEPIVQEIGAYVNKEDTLDKLYEEYKSSSLSACTKKPSMLTIAD